MNTDPVWLLRWRSSEAAISCGERFEVVEGTYQSARLAMLKFPSMDQARWWYDSEEYRGLKQMRLAATASNGFFMTGA
jgi:uncharacterized protein (DUF1330 family)